MPIRNEVYKKHLEKEGRTKYGIYTIILKDVRRKHKPALDLMAETTHEVFTPRTAHIATELVMKQLGINE